MLEIYMHAVANNTDDDFLDTINLGVGKYEEAEFWQQMESFRTGMFADAAMTKRIVERAVLEAKRKMVETIMERPGSKVLRNVDYPDPDRMSKREYFDKHAENIWEDLGTEDGEYTPEQHQAWLVSHFTGLDMNWTPPHWRMLKARHEGSRSKDGHLIDNVFGRPPEPAQVQPMEDY
jgi:hypothetical protein